MKIKAMRLAVLLSSAALPGVAHADENLFGYNTGAETLPKGSGEIYVFNTLRSDKGQGTYRAIDTEIEGEYGVNIEANHATLAGRSFHHEVAFAVANGIMGSVDANRGDPQNGWDTDQFPNSVDDLVMPLFEIIRNGGLGLGGFNFDAKLRRQSSDRNDLFHAHIGGLDTLAQALLAAADLVERGELATLKDARYRGWEGDLGQAILGGSLSLADLESRVASGAIDPVRHSGWQERLENVVNQSVWRAR